MIKNHYYCGVKKLHAKTCPQATRFLLPYTLIWHVML